MTRHDQATRDEFASRGDARLGNPELFGIKAAGLHALPDGWTPEFFALSARAVNDLDSEQLSNIITPGLEALGNCPEGVMVRSSATTENMDERGRFDSSECAPDTDAVRALIERLRAACKPVELGNLAFVVQKRVLSYAFGHLSNERRISSDPRSWLCEAERVPVPDSERSFRFRSDSEQRTTGNLDCSDAGDLSDTLRWAARNASSSRRERVHLEWLWDAKRVWIVQRDLDSTPEGLPPGFAWSAPANGAPEPKMTLFKPASELGGSRFPKVQNVATLADANLPFHSVYVLSGPRIISSLAAGRISVALRKDLDALIEAPVVVRTDVPSGAGRPVLMQKRTDTCRTVDQLEEFLKSAAKAHVDDGQPPGSLAFLAHRFLPARAGVFARARPGQSRVQVDSTWGLPDSLFYYPHDTFSVNTDSADVTRHLRCKVDFIDVDETGNWTPRRAGRPWDWRPSLSHDTALAIGRASLALAEYCDRELEVMFFAGTDATGNEWSLPWFFAEVDHPKAQLEPSRTFYAGDRRRITNQTDIDQLSAELEKADKSIVIVTLRPEVGLLRDREFVERVAELGTKFDVPIELEGSVLSHVYYLLDQAGARVRVVDPPRKREPRRAFGKLVRDLIPVRIERSGELADVYHPDSRELIQVVRAKLVEEALELYWADTLEDAREELADILEILQTAARVEGIGVDDVEAVAEDKRQKRGGFEQGVVLIETRDAEDPGATRRPLLQEEPRADRTRVEARRPVRLPSRRMRVPLVPPSGWERGKNYAVPLDASDEIVFSYSKDAVLLEVRARTAVPDARQLALRIELPDS